MERMGQEVKALCHLIVSVLGPAVVIGLRIQRRIISQQLADGGQVRTQIILNSFHVLDDVSKN